MAQENIKEWWFLALIVWFFYCFWTIYKNYYLLDSYYSYDFYIICGKLEAKTILFFLVYLIGTRQPSSMILKNWCLYSLFYIPILILVVIIIIKVQSIYYSFITSDFYYGIRNFMYGLFHPF